MNGLAANPSMVEIPTTAGAPPFRAARSRCGNNNWTSNGLRTQVHVEHGVPGVLGVGADRLDGHPAGGMDQAVDSFQLPVGGLDRGLHGGEVADVDHGARHAKTVGNLGDIRRDIPQRHLAAVVHQRLGTGPADTGRGTRHHHTTHRPHVKFPSYSSATGNAGV